jgi:replicative DNA helicase
MKHGLITDTEWEKIQKKMDEFADLGPAYIVSPPYEKRTVDDLILETQRLQGNSVVIDQLSYLQWKGNHANEHQGYREIVHGMKNAAIKMEIPWYCIVQFNREAANIEDMAGAHMAGLTRSIEETCDIFLGLHRDDEDREMGRVQLGIIEARHCSDNHKWNIEVDLNTTSSFVMTGEI